MPDCECNVCTVIKCLRYPNKATPVLSNDSGDTTAKLIVVDNCLCNVCQVFDCLRRPKKAMPITEQPTMIKPVNEPNTVIIEKVIIKEKPCLPQPHRLPPCDSSRITVYSVGSPVTATAYAVSQTRDQFRCVSYGVPHCDSSAYTNCSTNRIVTSLYGVKSPETSCNLDKHNNDAYTHKTKKKRRIEME